jgi:hypothetical protein
MLLGGLVVRSDGVVWCAIVRSCASGGIACRIVLCCDGLTRAADGIFAGRAAIVPLAEEIALGRRPVAVKRGGVLVVHNHLVGAPVYERRLVY